jgi:hypothetical protein
LKFGVCAGKISRITLRGFDLRFGIEASVQVFASTNYHLDYKPSAVVEFLFISSKLLFSPLEFLFIKRYVQAFYFIKMLDYPNDIIVVAFGDQV